MHDQPRRVAKEIKAVLGISDLEVEEIYLNHVGGRVTYYNTNEHGRVTFDPNTLPARRLVDFRWTTEGSPPRAEEEASQPLQADLSEEPSTEVPAEDPVPQAMKDAYARAVGGYRQAFMLTSTDGPGATEVTGGDRPDTEENLAELDLLVAVPGMKITLHTADPTAAGERSGSSYARVASGHWSAVTGGTPIMSDSWERPTGKDATDRRTQHLRDSRDTHEVFQSLEAFRDHLRHVHGWETALMGGIPHSTLEQAHTRSHDRANVTPMPGACEGCERCKGGEEDCGIAEHPHCYGCKHCLLSHAPEIAFEEMHPHCGHSPASAFPECDKPPGHAGQHSAMIGDRSYVGEPDVGTRIWWENFVGPRREN